MAAQCELNINVYGYTCNVEYFDHFYEWVKHQDTHSWAGFGTGFGPKLKKLTRP
jgi:hypothetical protein